MDILSMLLAPVRRRFQPSLPYLAWIAEIAEQPARWCRFGAEAADNNRLQLQLIPIKMTRRE
jgi:hypothetical protein